MHQDWPPLQHPIVMLAWESYLGQDPVPHKTEPCRFNMWHLLPVLLSGGLIPGRAGVPFGALGGLPMGHCVDAVPRCQVTLHSLPSPFQWPST
jgi:hypothetical protein